MLFGEGQFEKPGAGASPEGRPAEGQPAEGAAEQPEGPGGVAETAAEKQEETQESVERRYKERIDRLQGVLRDFAAQGFAPSLDTMMKMATESDGEYSISQAAIKNSEVRRVIDSARKKYKEIEEEKKTTLEALRAKKVDDFSSKIEGI